MINNLYTTRFRARFSVYVFSISAFFAIFFVNTLNSYAARPPFCFKVLPRFLLRSNTEASVHMGKLSIVKAGFEYLNHKKSTSRDSESGTELKEYIQLKLALDKLEKDPTQLGQLVSVCQSIIDKGGLDFVLDSRFLQLTHLIQNVWNQEQTHPVGIPFREFVFDWSSANRDSLIAKVKGSDSNIIDSCINNDIH